MTWKLEFQFSKDCHKYFREIETGRIAVADNSGHYGGEFSLSPYDAARNTSASPNVAEPRSMREAGSGTTVIGEERA